MTRQQLGALGGYASGRVKRNRLRTELAARFGPLSDRDFALFNEGYRRGYDNGQKTGVSRGYRRGWSEACGERQCA